MTEQAFLLVNLFNIFKARYLAPLFPAVSKGLGIIVTNPVQNGCPKEFLNLLLDFINRGRIPNELNDHSPAKDIGAAIIHTLLFATEENQELVFEILRQALYFQIWGDKPTSIIINWMAHVENSLNINGQDDLAAQSKHKAFINQKLRRLLWYYKGSLSERASDIEREVSIFSH